jgi:uncharacterized protein YjbI with pentapeptide repeats
MNQKPKRWAQLEQQWQQWAEENGGPDNLTNLECRFVACATKGEEFDCAPNGGVTGDEIDKIDDWEERRIRAEVIVALGAGEVPGWSVHPRWGLRLRGAKVAGQVDLSRADLTRCPLAFETCRFENGVKLYQATTADLAFKSCHLPTLGGKQLNSKASLYLTQTRLRHVSLADASFRGIVDLSKARVVNPGYQALSGERIRAASVYLCHAYVKGEVNVSGSQINGELDCRQARLFSSHGSRLAFCGNDLSASDVDFRGAHVKGELAIWSAQISSQFNCSWAHLVNPSGDVLSVDRTSAVDGILLHDICAEGSIRVVDVETNAWLSLDQAYVKGKVNISGATIGDQLHCGGAHFINPNDTALEGRGLSSSGVNLTNTRVEGTVNLVGATITGDVHIGNVARDYRQSARFINSDGTAFQCQDLRAANVYLTYAYVEGKVDLTNAQVTGSDLRIWGTYIKGEVTLMSTRISGDLSITGDGRYDGNTQLINPAETALNCQDLRATNVFLGNTHVEGMVQMWSARISSDFYCRKSTQLHNPRGEALSAQGCRVAGRLHFQLAEAAVGKIDLARAEIGVLHDDLDSWPINYPISLVGFSYYALEEAANLEKLERKEATKVQKQWVLEKRLAWVGKNHPYSPDVYNQLAAVYKRSGEEDHARKVAIARERARRERPSDITKGRRAWSLFLAYTVRYGYQPWLASIYFVVLLILGWGFFALPGAKHAMVPAPDAHGLPANATKDCQNHPCFSPFFYAFDALVPFIDFHQESSAYWVPAADQIGGWGWWSALISLLLSVSGWILLAAVAAGVGSLWRRE